MTAIGLLDLDRDRAISAVFFDPEAGFAWRDVPALAALRLSGQVIPNLAMIALVIVLFAAPSHRPFAIAGLAVHALGPGLAVNGILKPVMDRPRPIQSDAFSGAAPAKAWWDATPVAGGEFLSFPSGEAAASAWMIGLALFAPKPWRTPALIGATLYALAISILRIVFGAHWASDVIAAWAIVLVLWVAALALLRRAAGGPKLSA